MRGGTDDQGVNPLANGGVIGHDDVFSPVPPVIDIMGGNPQEGEIEALISSMDGKSEHEQGKMMDEALKTTYMESAKVAAVAETQAVGPTSEKKRKQEAFEDAVVAATKDGLWNQPAFGNKFQRTFGKNGSRHAEYAQVSGHAATEKFKLDWIQQEGDKITKTKTHLRAYQRVDTRHGKYVPIGAYIESFGIHYNREIAIKCGLRGAQQMMKMGGDWAYIEPISEALFVLQLQREFSEDLKNSWELYTSQSTTSTPAAASGEVGNTITNSASSSKQQKNTGKAASDKPQEKEAAKQKGTGTSAKAKKTAAAAAAAATSGKPESPGGSKTKSVSDIAIDEANKLKERYLKATGRAEKMMTWIPSMQE